ncbi:3-deoxy-D-manno-octulosonic acid transferase [Cognatishimia maritima]|uniref:3-deoxy-D-manno-octulosonic acid transferase n=1 Tax=Cognatishimia maritima TaxID=870908 RepID=A0A1M5N6R4_9RHOB|nr:3-deoxy-D-manno-octulosonic acid transferase [Cognatishimia maritima]SHG85122.1 3-deoxy-D-manno-octulosonic-acid transferase [Cognatishimia maritima]
MGLDGGSKILTAYLALTRAIDPVYRIAVARRRRRGKEHATRHQERFGITQVVRPEGSVIWMHAASVGETQSLLGLIPAILAQRPDVSIVLTSGTVTSAALLERDLPDRAIHQFSPVDTPAAIRRFLKHWKPDVAVWVESELWPRMMVETKRRGIPMMLLNARVSMRSLQRWSFARRAATKLFQMFDRILVQDQATFGLLGELNIPEEKRRLTGSLKAELAPALPAAEDAAEILRALDARPVWVAASTHVGEDEIILQAHKLLPKGTLLVLVPRHPDRGRDVKDLASGMSFGVARRSAGQQIRSETEVYVADTMGELGLWYRAAPVSFVGGSLVSIGGHNPYEPILLGSNVVHGPHVGNFADIYATLRQAGGCLEVDSAESLAEVIKPLLVRTSGADMLERATAALGSAQSTTELVCDEVCALLPDIAN